jgi:hypothetical protein
VYADIALEICLPGFVKGTTDTLLHVEAPHSLVALTCIQ